MNKIIITLTTDADVMAVNKDMNEILSKMIDCGILITEYTIQKGK